MAKQFEIQDAICKEDLCGPDSQGCITHWHSLVNAVETSAIPGLGQQNVQAQQ